MFQARRIWYYDPQDTLNAKVEASGLKRFATRKEGYLVFNLNSVKDLEAMALCSIPGAATLTRIYVASITDPEELWQDVLFRISRYLGDDREFDFATP